MSNEDEYQPGWCPICKEPEQICDAYGLCPGAKDEKQVDMWVKTAWFEMKPDCYGGEKFDEHIPMWNGYVEGDKQDDTTRQPLRFDPKDFPPGTKIIFQEPCCPKCGELYGNCMVRGYNRDDECDFDWKLWAEYQYG